MTYYGVIHPRQQQAGINVYRVTLFVRDCEEGSQAEFDGEVFAKIDAVALVNAWQTREGRQLIRAAQRLKEAI